MHINTSEWIIINMLRIIVGCLEQYIHHEVEAAECGFVYNYTLLENSWCLLILT